MADSAKIAPALGEDRFWSPSDPNAAQRLSKGPFSNASAAVIALLSAGGKKKTFQYKSGGHFELEKKDVEFLGVTRSIGHVTLAPSVTQTTRITLGPRDYEGYFQYNIDET